MKAVVNATPLIALARIGRLDLLQQLFAEVLIPPAVHHEVVVQGAGLAGASAVAGAAWIQIVSPEAKPTIEPLLLGLDLGEMETLLLAREVKADWVLIDERLGRRIAQALGLPIKGTVGILLAAARAGLISQEQAMADARQLTAQGIRVSGGVLQWLAEELGRSTTLS